MPARLSLIPYLAFSETEYEDFKISTQPLTFREAVLGGQHQLSGTAQEIHMDGERNVILCPRHTKLKNDALQETFHCFGFQSAAKKTDSESYFLRTNAVLTSTSKLQFEFDGVGRDEMVTVLQWVKFANPFQRALSKISVFRM